MRSQQAYSAQEEILLTSLATCCARVGSAIDDFVRGQNSNKQKKHIIFLKFLKMVQDQPGRPGESPEVSPETSFGSKTRFFRILKLRLFWPSGPSPGASGPSRQPLDLPSRAAWGVPGWFGGLLKVEQSPLLRSWVYGGHKWTARGLEQ